MKKFILVLSILGATMVSALAQQPVPPAQPEFVPIVIDKPKLDQFLGWLNDQPGRFSVPVTDFLRAWEAAAVEEAKKAADDAAKKADDAKLKVSK
jgi:hypothetical protein